MRRALVVALCVGSVVYTTLFVDDTGGAPVPSERKASAEASTGSRAQTTLSWSVGPRRRLKAPIERNATLSFGATAAASGGLRARSDKPLATWVASWLEWWGPPSQFEGLSPAINPIGDPPLEGNKEEEETENEQEAGQERSEDEAGRRRLKIGKARMKVKKWAIKRREKHCDYAKVRAAQFPNVDFRTPKCVGYQLPEERGGPKKYPDGGR